MQPLGETGVASSMLGWAAGCARGAFGCMGPLHRAGRHRRRTRLGEGLVVHLTSFSAPSLFGSPRIGGSDARASSLAAITSLVLAHRSVQRDHRRRRLAAARMQVLEVSFEVLSEMLVGPA